MLENNITTIQIGNTGKKIFIPDADTIQNMLNRISELESTVTLLKKKLDEYDIEDEGDDNSN